MIRDEVKLTWRKDARLWAQGEISSLSTRRTLTGLLALCFDVDNAISYKAATMNVRSRMKSRSLNFKTSLLLMGARNRLLGAVVMTALLWLAVAWAFEWEWKLTQALA